MKYYSEVLDKVFETEKELKAAEKAKADEEAKKAEAKALVKQESEKVNEAFKVRNDARRAYNEKLVEARKVYNKALADAKAEFEKSLSEASDKLSEAEADYDAKLKEFQKAHPEGYHITLKDGDNVVTLTGLNNGTILGDINKQFDDILDMFSNMLRRW